MKKNTNNKKKADVSPVLEDARIASLMGRKKFQKMKEQRILSGQKDDE